MPDNPIEPAHPPPDEDSQRRSPLLKGATTDPGDASTVMDDGKSPAIVSIGAGLRSTFPTEQAATVIGRYKLVRELGKGGFGIVWQAEQTEPIRREVALKIIKQGMDSREIIARFEAERQALALMDHPNIAAVFDAGTTERGLPYFVMELVKGVPITEYCDTHKLGIRERLELFIPVCQAVQHAHQKAILHRDLKPSNILVTEVDGKPAPKVIDFGIAKALGTSREELLQASLALTQDGMIVGTPLYMSPEQAGSMPDVDTRSDVYTLGVILYELLVGETPLSREQLRKAALDEVLRLVREGEPRRPSSRFLPSTELAKTTASMRRAEPKKLGHALRGDLDWIVLKALEKDRARRYDTANAFAHDLQRHLSDEPVSAGPPSAGYRLGKLARRNRLAFAAAGCILVLLAAGIAVSTWQAVRATTAEKLAEGRRVQAETAATQARESLSQSDFMQALRSINEDRIRDALAQLARSLSVNPRNDAALCRLTTLLMYHGFALPISNVNSGNGTVSTRFSADGKRIATASDDHTARVWDAQDGQPMTKPMKHGAEVRSVQFSPDGKRIVTASADNTARVWDAQTGEPLTQPLKHDGEVEFAQFSPDGKWIVTTSDDNSARVWDAQSGQPLSEPMKHDGIILSARFSPRGEWIVTASADKTARVWDARSGHPLTGPLQHDGEVYSAQFSPDGSWVVTASDDKTARVWDARSGHALSEPMKHDGVVRSAQFSPDGKQVSTASGGTVRAWDARSGNPLGDSLELDGRAERSQFSADGRRIVTASRDEHGGTARVWDVQSGQALCEPVQHRAKFYPVQFSADGKRIVTMWDGPQVWDALSGEALSEPLHHADGVDSAEFSADGKRIVTASWDKTARVWDAESGQPLTKPLQHNARVYSARFSPDGRRIVTASMDKTARVWDAESGEPLTGPLPHDDEVTSAQFSPDGKWILTGSLDKRGGTARVWDAQSGKLLTELFKNTDGVTSAHFSVDGKRIVTASGKTARVWDARSGQPLTGPMKPAEWLYSAQFSPNGKRIVTGAGKGQFGDGRVWDARSGQSLVALAFEYEGKVRSAQFSVDGKRILTASMDNTARVWDAESGQPLTEPLKHTDSVYSARFSPDGKWIVTTSDDNTARVWDARSGQPLTEPLKQRGGVDSVAFSQDVARSAEFSPDGKRILTESGDNTARVWDISARGQAPAWLPRLAEAVAGQRLSARGVFEQRNEDQGRVLEEIRAQLSRAPSDDDWTIWGRWFLADRSTRTISPFSKITVPEYIENRIKENTPASLGEAERLAPGNTELLQRIAQARAQLKKKEPQPVTPPR